MSILLIVIHFVGVVQDSVMPITSGSYSRIHTSSAVILCIMLLAFIYKHTNLFFLITFGLLNVSYFHFLFCTVCFIQEIFTLHLMNQLIVPLYWDYFASVYT